MNEGEEIEMRQERVEQLYMEIDSDNWNNGFFFLTNKNQNSQMRQKPTKRWTEL